MSKDKVTQTVEPIISTVVIEEVKILDPTSPEIVPNNKQVADYFEQGYEITDFRTRNNDAAKDEAKRLKNEGKLAAKINLLQGWFSVFVKDAPPTKQPAVGTKTTRPDVPMVYEGKEFKSTKEARGYARLILEAARSAEFDADVALAKAAKIAKEAADKPASS